MCNANEHQILKENLLYSTIEFNRFHRSIWSCPEHLLNAQNSYKNIVLVSLFTTDSLEFNRTSGSLRSACDVV